ncbi:hypothetical protein LN736_14905 [Clostridium sp. WLY-B-L2]|uniref:Uncharacterized protein n=1 Tax=Clostridium aromativorans TaxID=2836848 RepID=A0ABS8N8L1_9CLOT|nr:hypothetical protein [Clostridium aromativorans]MCC9296147.1 hypothetical protein [Clostridium aromativorans]
MNKKRLLTATLASVLIAASTAVIAFASQYSASSTKNVVKLAGDKENSTSKAAASKTVTLNTDTGEIILTDTDQAELTDELKKMENGTIRSKPEAVQDLKNLINDIKSGKIKLLDISDEQAVKTAKNAIKYYTGLDVEEVIRRDGLRPYITRYNSPYAWGPDILVSFDGEGNTKDNISASISAVDGKVYNVTAIIGRYPKVNIDNDKVNEAAASFLKDKGFGDNFKSIAVDNEKTSAGIVGAKALYEDGTEILMEFNASDNSVVNFTHYNLKTMKFAK